MTARSPRPGRRRERTPEQAAAAAAAREERLAGLHAQLAEGVAAIRDGAAWRDWLDVAGRFHRYSFNNQVLISAQNPQATHVAGYQAWAAMGRQVRKGEKAIWVLAPVTRRTTPDTATDADELTAPTTTVGGTEPGGPTDRRRGPVVGFRGAAVFDVSQTDGDPLPEPPHPELLTGNAPPGLWNAVTDVITGRGFTVTRCPDPTSIGGANGITDYATRTVTVRADVDDAMACKTLLHEAGHTLLHNPQHPGTPGPQCRDLIEVEAESVAYLVAAHHGLDTAGYTFAYIAGWAGRDDTAVAATATRVLHAARALIDATDPTTAEQAAAAAQLTAAAHTAAAVTTELAARAEATRDRLAAAVAGPEQQHVRAVLADTQAWFLDQAATSSAYAAAVTGRGHTPDTTLAHGVGYAPATWTGLVDHLRSRGHTTEDLLAAGVATTARHGRLIDRFRGRITFPIHDCIGVVGFTARDTTGTPDTPKYLNSPAGALYDKSRLLYGTQQLTDDTRTVVLVEGPWDALAVTTSGGGETIGLAACGTAVTEAHLDLALGRREARQLVLAPDNDPAGTTALGRTLAMLAQRGGTHPHAVRTGSGKDLADLHAAGGATAVREALASTGPAGLEHARAHLAGRPPGPTPEARVAAARTAAAHTSGLTLGQRAQLGALLIDAAGISPDTALAIVTPPAAAPKRVAAVPVSVGPAAARPALRR